MEKARAARAGADETEAQWRARMDAARLEASRIAQQAKQESARETEARVREALGEIDARVERARLRIRNAVEDARVQMEAVAAEAAEQMVEQLTGLKVDRRDAAKAVAEELQLMSAAGERDQVRPAERRLVSSRAR